MAQFDLEYYLKSRGFVKQSSSLAEHVNSLVRNQEEAKKTEPESDLARRYVERVTEKGLVTKDDLEHLKNPLN